MNAPSTRELYESCLQQLKQRYTEGRVAVAYSGGVDSSLLTRLLLDALGEERVDAVIADSPSLARGELSLAESQAAALEISLLRLETNELSQLAYRRNDRERCFHCKSELFSTMTRLQQQRGWAHIVYGANKDDLGDHRPGMRAAEDFGVEAPLLELGLGKDEVRALARLLNLPSADKPAKPCLASRIPYGTEVTAERLRQIDQAEAVLTELGFREFRVRYHGELARLVFSDCELERALTPTMRETFNKAIGALGFRYVTIDLEPFRSGRLNDALRAPREVMVV